MRRANVRTISTLSGASKNAPSANGLGPYRARRERCTACSGEAGAHVMNGAPPRTRPVEPGELATVGEAYGPTPQDRLEDDRERALHRTDDDGSSAEEQAKKSRA